jgi:hypothetical protein
VGQLKSPQWHSQCLSLSFLMYKNDVIEGAGELGINDLTALAGKTKRGKQNGRANLCLHKHCALLSPDITIKFLNSLKKIAEDKHFDSFSKSINGKEMVI